MPDTPPRTARDRRSRPVQEGIPPTRAQREELLRVIREYLCGAGAVPPLSLEELQTHTAKALRLARAEAGCEKYAAVLINNEVWRERLAAVPYTRRLLLLPQCLRDEARCRAEMDGFGLLCRQCRSCLIGDLQSEAERLGYVVLVSEGTTIVSSLVQSGLIEAVVGVSCLSVLERIFPHISAAAVPGIAIPLLQEGCADTGFDTDYLWEALYLSGEDGARRVDLGLLRREVSSWFTPESVAAILGPPAGQTEQIAQSWLAEAGKRWRPFLAACAFEALSAERDENRGDVPVAAGSSPLPQGLRQVALAVECFHKASLVHDDIEDGDALRYGKKALHERHGVPIAMNVGDFLLGEGYRLISACQASEPQRAKMLRVAAEGHRKLALGQGAELSWRREPRPLSIGEVLGIFARKTAPAFDVALRLGAILAGAQEPVWRALSSYSEAVGIAYQIRDDLRDLQGQPRLPTGEGQDEPGDAEAMRPSLPLALAYERAGEGHRQFLKDLWRGRAQGLDRGRLAAVLAETDAEAAAAALLESYKLEAIHALTPLASANLKGLLRRVVGRIFDDVDTMSCCREYKAGHAAGRPVGPGPAA